MLLSWCIEENFPPFSNWQEFNGKIFTCQHYVYPYLWIIITNLVLTISGDEVFKAEFAAFLDGIVKLAWTSLPCLDHSPIWENWPGSSFGFFTTAKPGPNCSILPDWSKCKITMLTVCLNPFLIKILPVKPSWVTWEKVLDKCIISQLSRNYLVACWLFNGQQQQAKNNTTR